MCRAVYLLGPMPSIRDIAKAKQEGRKLAMVTAYDAWTARLLAETPVDMLLVGDSVMMVVHGDKDTLGATTEIMVLHTRAVAKGAGDKFIVADMPFLAARKGPVFALDCAAELLRAGAHAVKIEGIEGHADVIRHLVQSGIPVMGHLGLTPQWVHSFGGFTVQAREASEAEQLKKDAIAVQEAGAFSLVLECIPMKLAKEVTASLSIPTIGIGAGADCDGQVLVLQDLLGCNPDFKPRFVKRYADTAALIKEGVSSYCREVTEGKFPSSKESFGN